MANSRPRGDRPRRSSRKGRTQIANAEGLGALGSQMRGGARPGAVANESGLKALGAKVDQTHGKRSGGGMGSWSPTRKVVTVLTTVLVLALLGLGGLYGYGRYEFDKTQKANYDAEVAARSGQPFTMLVIGSDSRVGENPNYFGSASAVTGQRSDVIQLWRVTPSARQIQVLSIPRDTVVSMIGANANQFGRYNRINASFNLGANQLIKTITANFGIQINYTLQVDFAGFEGAVNSVGGVYLNFNYPAKDSYSGLNITTPGCQLLSGFQALGVARARHYEYYKNGYWQYDPTSDFGRIQRQDAFIRSLIDRAKSTVNPLKIFGFINSIGAGVVIDARFGYNQLLGLALEYRSFNTSALAGQTVPTASGYGFGGLGSVLAVEQPAAQQLLVNLFGSDLLQPTDPPPGAGGSPNPPPTVTPTTAAPAPPAASGAPATATPTTAPPQPFNPTPC